MKFIDLLYELLIEEIDPHYTLRKGRLQDDVYLILDLNLFAPSEKNNNKNFRLLLKAMNLANTEEEVKKYIDFLSKYQTKELDSAYEVGVYTIPSDEITKINNKLERLEKRYTDFFKKQMEINKPETKSISLVVHDYENFGEDKILNLLNDDNYIDNEIKMFTEKVIKFANNPKNENYFKNLRYSLKDIIKLYIKNEPLPGDDKGSIGELVTVILKERFGNSIDMVTLFYDRTSRIYERHHKEGGLHLRWNEFEKYENEVRLGEKSKSSTQPQTVDDKIIKFKKLKNASNNAPGSEDMFNLAKQYYDTQKDFDAKETDKDRKLVFDKLLNLKNKLYTSIYSLDKRGNVNRDVHIAPIGDMLKKEITYFYDNIYQER